MDPVAAARREVALDIQRLAEEFGRSDAAAFRRTHLGCWAVAGLVTVPVVILLVVGGDRRCLGLLWVAIVGPRLGRPRLLHLPPAPPDGPAQGLGGAVAGPDAARAVTRTREAGDRATTDKRVARGEPEARPGPRRAVVRLSPASD